MFSGSRVSGEGLVRCLGSFGGGGGYWFGGFNVLGFFDDLSSG